MGSCRQSERVGGGNVMLGKQVGQCCIAEQIRRQRALFEICAKVGLYFAKQPPMNFAIGSNDMT